MMDNHYWLYILKCNNGCYYTGYTTNLHRRYKEHIAGTAKCKYTRSFKPLYIASAWHVLCSRSTILSIEQYIKKLSKQEKEQLIACPMHFIMICQRQFDCTAIVTVSKNIEHKSIEDII